MKLSKIFFIVFVSLLALNVETASAQRYGEQDLGLNSRGLPQGFDLLTGLVGKWEGTHVDEYGTEEKVPVETSLTSGGTAIVEKLYAGTEKEMVSVYHPNGSSIMVAHYCMLGNQPRFKLVALLDNVFKFEFVDGSNMKGLGDTHMHSLLLTIVDKDHFNQEWALFERGKLSKKEQFKFVRKN